MRMSPHFTAFITTAAIRASSAAVYSVSAKAVGHMAASSRFASCMKPNVRQERNTQFDCDGKSIELYPLFRFPVRCRSGLLLCWIGELQALLSGALASLNLRVVRGKSLAFKKRGGRIVFSANFAAGRGEEGRSPRLRPRSVKPRSRQRPLTSRASAGTPSEYTSPWSPCPKRLLPVKQGTAIVQAVPFRGGIKLHAG
jgi:hypothetical protein